MRKLLIILLAVFSVASANAATLTSGAGWSTFDFEDVGSSWGDTFTFTITEASILTVTDVFKAGDQLEVFADGVSLGLTSLPTGTGFTSDFDLAAADAGWSTGSWSFLAGTYVISGLAELSPFGDGVGALRLDSNISAVPVPAALFLFAPAVLGFFGLRRKSAAAA